VRTRLNSESLEKNSLGYNKPLVHRLDPCELILDARRTVGETITVFADRGAGGTNLHPQLQIRCSTHLKKVAERRMQVIVTNSLNIHISAVSVEKSSTYHGSVLRVAGTVRAWSFRYQQRNFIDRWLDEPKSNLLFFERGASLRRIAEAIVVPEACAELSARRWESCNIT